MNIFKFKNPLVFDNKNLNYLALDEDTEHNFLIENRDKLLSDKDYLTVDEYKKLISINNF